MRFIVMLIFMTTLASWAQKNQTDFMFLLGLERTDEQVATFFKDQFDLSDAEYSSFWTKRPGDDDYWAFEAVSKTEEYKFDFPISLNVQNGKITSIYVEKFDLSVVGKEKYKAFYSADFPGGFKFDMIKKELKKIFEPIRLKFFGKRNPIKSCFRYFRIIGYHSDLPGNHSLRIVGSDKGKSVMRLIYK